MPKGQTSKQDAEDLQQREANLLSVLMNAGATTGDKYKLCKMYGNRVEIIARKQGRKPTEIDVSQDGKVKYSPQKKM